MERWPAIGILLGVEILVGFQSWIIGITELAGLFVRDVVSRLQAFTALWVVI
jgi:hypothetical protein